MRPLSIPVRGASAAGLAVLALAAAGCGGSKSPAVASLTTSSSHGGTHAGGAGGDRAKSEAALARCLSDRGFRAYVGGSGSSGENVLRFAGVTIPGNVDPSSPQFQAAQRACSKYLPGGGPPPLSAAQKAESIRDFTRFAACMRKHGVSSFPDPDSAGIFPLSSIDQLDTRTPTFQSADKACQGLMAKVGPRFRFG